MRRWAATIVMLLLAAGTIVPMAVASVTSRPACCRRGGMHHCGMPQEEGFHPAGTTCPFCAQTLPVPAVRPEQRAIVVAPAAAHPFLDEFYPAPAALPDRRTQSSRAPPVASFR